MKYQQAILSPYCEVVENSVGDDNEQETASKKENVIQSEPAPESKIAKDRSSTNNKSDSLPTEQRTTRDIPKNAEALLVASGPSVRRLERELDVDLTRIKGKGKRGRLLKEDVKAYVKSSLSKSAQEPVSSYTLPDVSEFGSVRREDMTEIEKVTSAHMQRAWNMVHVHGYSMMWTLPRLNYGVKNLKPWFPS